MSRGYFTIAQGQAYQRLAYALALSLKISQPKEFSKLSIGVTSEELKTVNPKYKKVFDEIVEIPWKDHAEKSSWKLENEWKAIYMTPYEETIKLDADMLFPSDVSAWWDAMSYSDGIFCTAPISYRGEKITSDFYRKTYTESGLPNVYTAMFYFKKNDVNYELFQLAEDIFNNWERYFYEFLGPDNRPKIVSTDVVFAIAAKILNYEEHNRTPHLNLPTFVHMKSQLQGWTDNRFMVEDWTKMIPSYFGRDCSIMIGNYKQTLPFHYHVKEFVTDKMIATMERKLGI
jgi:hypothetical protein